MKFEIYFNNQGTCSMCSTNIILNILKIHADGRTQTTGNEKKMARRIKKKSLRTKQQAALCNLVQTLLPGVTLIYLHKLPFDFTFDKKSVIAVQLVKLTTLAIYMMQNAIQPFFSFQLNTSLELFIQIQISLESCQLLS